MEHTLRSRAKDGRAIRDNVRGIFRGRPPTRVYNSTPKAAQR
jgi:hypothetical protein